jgi:hypothetical protein
MCLQWALFAKRVQINKISRLFISSECLVCKTTWQILMKFGIRGTQRNDNPHIKLAYSLWYTSRAFSRICGQENSNLLIEVKITLFLWLSTNTLLSRLLLTILITKIIFLFYGSFVRAWDESFILYYQMRLDLRDSNTSQPGSVIKK